MFPVPFRWRSPLKTAADDLPCSHSKCMLMTLRCGMYLTVLPLGLEKMLNHLLAMLP